MSLPTTQYRAVWVDPVYTITDTPIEPEQAAQAIRRTPGTALADGIGGLLDKLSERFTGDGGVVILGAEAAAELWPDGSDPAALVADAERHGWTTRKLGDWSTWTKDARPTAYVADTRHIPTRPDEFPLWTGYPPDLVARLRIWHELTGSPWRLTPSASGLAILADLDAARHTNNRVSKRAVLKQDDTPDGAAELDYHSNQWRNVDRENLPAYMHGYDSTRMYIAAAMVTEVCPWRLKHTGRIEFDRRKAGWWQVELAPWQHPHMPDPAGYLGPRGHHDDDPRRIVRWITTPRLTLLEELTGQGLYGGVRIVDSYTGPARDYPLRPYAERMRDAYALKDIRTKRVRTDIDPQDAEAIRAALKLVGHKTFGALAAPKNWVYRPHWWHSIVAQAAANLWRRTWSIGVAEDRWPVEIDVDNVWYGSDLPRWDEAAPKALRIDPTGMKLGTVKHGGTRRLKDRETE